MMEPFSQYQNPFKTLLYEMYNIPLPGQMHLPTLGSVAGLTNRKGPHKKSIKAIILRALSHLDHMISAPCET